MKIFNSPFEFIRLSDSDPERFADGRLISTHEKCGFFVCTRGELKIAFGGEEYMLRKGDAYAYMPSTMFRPICRSFDVDGLMVLVDVDYILTITLKVIGIENLMYIREHPFVTLTEVQYNTMCEGILRLQERVEKTDLKRVDPVLKTLHMELQKSIVQTLYYDMLSIMLQRHKPEQIVRSKHDEIFLRFMTSLFKNYRKEREVTFYANEQCISPRYFTTIIREKSGRSAIQWISSLLINDMKQMLETSNASVKEISEYFGFQTQSFFGKYFKQYVGVSPRMYRKSIMVGM